MTDRSAWGKEDVGTVDNLKSGTVDVLKDHRSAGGTISSGPVSANVASGTVDVSGFDKFSVVMKVDVAGPGIGPGTIPVEKDVRVMPGADWGSIDVVTVDGLGKPQITKITQAGYQLRTVPLSAGTLTATYRGRA